jgi:hypothetical protein
VNAHVGDFDGNAHEPSPQESEAWDRVRRAATGMTHHQAKAALEAARKAAKNSADTGPDAVIRQAELEEWERVTETLADHAGEYDPRSDPYVQGALAARADRERAARRDG